MENFIQGSLGITSGRNTYQKKKSEKGRSSEEKGWELEREGGKRGGRGKGREREEGQRRRIKKLTSNAVSIEDSNGDLWAKMVFQYFLSWGGKKGWGRKMLSLLFSYEPIICHSLSFGRGVTLGGQFLAAEGSSQWGTQPWIVNSPTLDKSAMLKDWRRTRCRPTVLMLPTGQPGKDGG